jgi:hypothetical protein
LSFLHVIAPFSEPSSRAMLGLMKLVTQRLPNDHNVLVLGDDLESNELRMYGFSVLGSVQGLKNKSLTLGDRVRRAVAAVATKKDYLIAWGWSSTVAVSGLDITHQVVGYVDAIDAAKLPEIEIDKVIPTTLTCGELMKKSASGSQAVMEPLVGIDAKTLVVDKNSVINTLQIPVNTLVVAVVNDVGKWQEIVAFVVQMKTLKIEVTVVVSDSYVYYSELHFALMEHRIENNLRRTMGGIRLIDVVHAATFVWAPTSLLTGALEGVLDLLSASASGTPIAASNEHAIGGVPMIGSRIAWVSSVSELSAWAADLFKNPDCISDQGSEIAARVRSIASPTKFVEGFQLRLQ